MLFSAKQNVFLVKQNAFLNNDVTIEAQGTS